MEVAAENIRANRIAILAGTNFMRPDPSRTGAGSTGRGPNDQARKSSSTSCLNSCRIRRYLRNAKQLIEGR